MNGSATVTIAAPAATVWSLVTDITRIGEFSPETFDAHWITDPPGPAADARFRGHVRRNGRGPTYWTDCRVLRCEPISVFEFGVYIGNRLVKTWTFQLREVVGGTAVIESLALARTPATRLYWRLAGRCRARTNQRGMRQTLHRLKAVAENSPATARAAQTPTPQSIDPT